MRQLKIKEYRFMGCGYESNEEDYYLDLRYILRLTLANHWVSGYIQGKGIIKYCIPQLCKPTYYELTLKMEGDWQTTHVPEILNIILKDLKEYRLGVTRDINCLTKGIKNETSDSDNPNVGARMRSIL